MFFIKVKGDFIILKEVLSIVNCYVIRKVKEFGFISLIFLLVMKVVLIKRCVFRCKFK